MPSTSAWRVAPIPHEYIGLLGDGACRRPSMPFSRPGNTEHLIAEHLFVRERI